MDRKVAIVTGSRRGIGKAIVIKLAQKRSEERRVGKECM